jgi:hypothetical protein
MNRSEDQRDRKKLEAVKSFFRIASAYIGARAFTIKHIRNKKAVTVEQNGDKHIYHHGKMDCNIVLFSP